MKSFKSIAGALGLIVPLALGMPAASEAKGGPLALPEGHFAPQRSTKGLVRQTARRQAVPIDARRRRKTERRATSHEEPAAQHMQ